VAQALPQAPQLLVVSSGVHCPLQQPWPLPHTVPQAPQLLASVLRLTQTPLQKV
jgi:hypothetical protein